MTQEQVSSQALACLEVWGGNGPVDRALCVPGLDVWVYAVPFENASAGGDVHFVSSCGSGRIARLVVADVSGHGATVAETARTLRSLIWRFMNHVDQRRLVMSMNQEFTRLADQGRFATAVVATYFSPTGALSLCNAGHPPPLLYSKAAKSWRYLEASAANNTGEGDNFPLGILSDGGYQQFDTALKAGDLLLCYTDSLVEAVCRDGSFLGAQRLAELVGTVETAEPAHLIHHLLAKMAVYGATLNDDVTLLLARCSGPAPGAGLLPRLAAQCKFLAQVLTLRRNIPWPELSVRNLGGSLIPALNHPRRKSQR